MQILRILILFGLFFLTNSDVFAQKEKKLSKRQIEIQEFYRQEALKESYQKQMIIAERAFRQKKFDEAIQEYIKALEFQENDQIALSKINDIEIILSKKDFSNVFQTIPNNTIEIKEVPLNSNLKTTEVQKDTVALTKTISTIELNKKEVLIDSINKNDVKKIEKEEKAILSITQPKENYIEPSITKSIDKTSATYRKALAAKYSDDHTQEFLTENNRKIVRRILKSNGLADEYLKVSHPWGGVYYFKNGESISFQTWVAETDKFFPE